MLSLHLIFAVPWQLILRDECPAITFQVQRTFDLELFVKLVRYGLRLASVYLCSVDQTFLVAKGHEQTVPVIMILLYCVHDTYIYRGRDH